MGLRPPPKNHLAPQAERMWQISGLLFGVLPLAVVAVVAGILLVRLTDVGWWVILALPAAVLVIGVPLCFLIARIQWNHWRYEIGEDEVDLMRGVFIITRTLVPMARIQHVDTRSGPIERRLGLATVVLHTAAGANEIPALYTADAEALRDRIAIMANTYEDL